MSNEPESKPEAKNMSVDIETVLQTYREVNKMFINSLMTQERAPKVVALVNGISKVMNEAKADCLIATLAMAMTVENTFKFVFDGAKPEENK